ncbi:MAG: amidohydrolase family protein [Acidimicrobiales bacterium]
MAPARPAAHGRQVAITDGRITAVGKVDEPGVREVAADGALVTPGWVDVHSHYDGQATWDDELAPSSWHGVTTLVMGNRGVGSRQLRRTATTGSSAHGGRGGHLGWPWPRDHVGVGDLPSTSTPSSGGAGPPTWAPRSPTAPCARLRHGRPRLQRAGHHRRHRGHGRDVRDAIAAGALASPPAAPSPTGPSTRTGPRHLRRRGRAVRHRQGAGRAGHRRVQLASPASPARTRRHRGPRSTG